jgi:ribosome-associated protein
MARRMHSTDPDAPDPYEGVPSRAAKMNKQHEITTELATLGLALAALSPAARAKLELPDALEQAIFELSNASRGARVRQRRFVARLLRAYDADALTHAAALLDPSSPASLARTRLIERWRDRMTAAEGGDAACEEFLAAYATAERQTLRQLVRAASKEGAADGDEGQVKKGKSATAKRRALYQYLRDRIAEADPRPAAPRPRAEDARDDWDDSDDADGDDESD